MAHSLDRRTDTFIDIYHVPSRQTYGYVAGEGAGIVGELAYRLTRTMCRSR
jgi:hypothetical protein